MGLKIRMSKTNFIAFIFIFCCAIVSAFPQFIESHSLSANNSLNADTPLISCVIEEESYLESTSHEISFTAPLVTFFIDLFLRDPQVPIQTAYLPALKLPHQTFSPAHFHIPPPLA